MLVDSIIRGNDVAFEVTFLDADGAVVDPISAQLVISYINSTGTRVSITMAMSSDSASSVWTASWDSGVAKAGRVYWSAQSESPPAAKDGLFDLKANIANLVL